MSKQDERTALVIVGDKHKGGSFVEYVHDRATARKNAAWYRSRGYRVFTLTAAEYMASLK